jgi:alpha-1,3-rhamnosyltransferase
MKDNFPLVSILAICYNHEKHVKETLDSILHQTYSNIQLIIIDDCSQDNSVNEIESWIKVNSVDCLFIARKENIGLCKNLNEGIELCKGEYYQSIACDDVLELQKIERQVTFFENEPDDVMVICSNFSTIDKSGIVISETYFKEDFIFPKDVFSAVLSKYMGYQIIVHSPTVLVRKKVFDLVGKYDESLKQEDFYMWLLISSKFSIGYINERLAKYRVLDTSLSKQFKFEGSFFYERTKVIAKFYDRKGKKLDAVLKFQLKQVKRIINEGLIVKDKNMIINGLEIYSAMPSVYNNSTYSIDKNLFKIYISYPKVFKKWAKNTNFKFVKNKYQLVYRLGIAPIFKRLFNSKIA